MTDTIEIEVSDGLGKEVAYGILGRAQDIHDNPDDEFEEAALELRDVGQELLDEFE